MAEVSFSDSGAPLTEESGDSWVDFFCSIGEYLAQPHEEADDESIAFAHHEYGDGVPDDCLIIGSSGRDDLLLLRLSGDRRGQIDLKIVDDWDPERDGKESDTYPVAESFSALLAMLHE
jgi:SMI1/KNR4 family protein SUKH-1